VKRACLIPLSLFGFKSRYLKESQTTHRPTPIQNLLKSVWKKCFKHQNTEMLPHLEMQHPQKPIWAVLFSSNSKA